MTFRRASPDREAWLRLTMDWLDTLPLDLELILVEQDDESRLRLDDENHNYPVRHIPVYNPGLFNRSWGLNVGVRHATSDKLIFADSDIIMHPNAIVEAARYLDHYDAVSPFGRLIDLNERQTHTLCRVRRWTYDWPGETRIGVGFCAGIVAYQRQALATIHGWDERFEGWGCEDHVQWFKTRGVLRVHFMRYRAFHLHHERSPASGTDQHAHYTENTRLHQRYGRDPTLLRDECAQPNLGDSERYRGKPGEPGEPGAEQ
jgi:glycosyltransferase involved in cell wall biosynthesis